MSLALSTALYEWRRYLAAVVALAVAGLLVLAMAGLFMGMSKSFSATVDRSPADVMVLAPQADSLFGDDSGQPRRLIPEIYQHPDVLEVQALNLGFSGWSNFPAEGQPAKNTGVQLVIVDPVKGGVTMPSDFPDDLILALQEPLAVVVDRSSLGQLGVKVGDRAKMSGYTVWVRGTTSGYPNTFNPTVFISAQTAKLLHQYNDGPRVGAIVVKLRDPKQAARVAGELNTMSHGQYRAWTRDALSAASQKSLLHEGGIVMFLGFAVVVGAFIGIVITWQTLQGALLANIREFASLRALGVSMWSLRLIVMELSAWVGVAGLAMTAVLTGGCWALARAFDVPLDFPLFVVIPVATTLFLVAVLSGLLSLGVLKKSQPADLLR